VAGLFTQAASDPGPMVDFKNTVTVTTTNLNIKDTAKNQLRSF
jgi:ATP-dependent Clp protease ATP-binding subunit ClpA